jgi:MFS transporter, UMF1 family
MSTQFAAPPTTARPPVRAFGLWDWGMSAFSSVILTFVFATYVTSGVAAAGVDPGQADAARAEGAALLGTTQTWGALAIALLAPLLGGLADSGGLRNLFLRLFTVLTAVTVAAMFVVEPDRDLLLLGCVLISVALVFSELAGVMVNSVLPQVSTLENRGRVSGTAWALGYFGSILCLVLVLALFYLPLAGGQPLVSEENGLNLRLTAVFSAVWIIVFTLPLMLRTPPSPRDPGAPPWTPWGGYATIGRHIRGLWRSDRRMLWYLGASAVYRDGLGAIFSFAGVIAAASYGFSTVDLIVFGIVANLAAGIGTFLGGKVDDWVGPRLLVLVGCALLLVFGTVILLDDRTATFWVFGLLLSFLVGPIQSASRSLLTKLSVAERETEAFGLYATSGRAIGFLSPALFALFVGLAGDTRAGIAGILLVVLLGGLLFLPIRLGDAGVGRLQRGRAAG